MKMKASKLLEEVIRIAKENPDAVYHGLEDGCYYNAGTVSGGEQCYAEGCLIGQAIRNIYPETYDSEPMIGCGADVEDLYDLFSTGDYCKVILQMLGDIQRAQDSGMPWGSCIQEVIEVGI
jgi:hypothetical protein